MRDPLLPAAVLVASGVRLVVVGTAALMVHRDAVEAKDLDVVPECSPRGLEVLGPALAQLVILGRAPAMRELAVGDVLTLATSYGPVDLMMRRGREEFEGLALRAVLTCVHGVEVPIASATDAFRLRHLFKVDA